VGKNIMRDSIQRWLQIAAVTALAGGGVLPQPAPSISGGVVSNNPTTAGVVPGPGVGTSGANRSQPGGSGATASPPVGGPPSGTPGGGTSGMLPSGR
jgi:hypothetical protein